MGWMSRVALLVVLVGATGCAELMVKDRFRGSFGCEAAEVVRRRRVGLFNTKVYYKVKGCGRSAWYACRTEGTPGYFAGKVHMGGGGSIECRRARAHEVD